MTQSAHLFSEGTPYCFISQDRVFKTGTHTIGMIFQAYIFPCKHAFYEGNRITPGSQQRMGDEDEYNVKEHERFPEWAYLRWSSRIPGRDILQTATTKEQFLLS